MAEEIIGLIGIDFHDGRFDQVPQQDASKHTLVNATTRYKHIVHPGTRQLPEFLQVISFRVGHLASQTEAGREAPGTWVLCLSNEYPGREGEEKESNEHAYKIRHEVPPEKCRRFTARTSHAVAQPVRDCLP